MQSNLMESSASLEISTLPAIGDGRAADAEGERLDQAAELNAFLADVERRACRIAEVAVRNRDDALDIVQGAMLRLARSYAARPASEWKPIFYRILWNGIRDWQRRRAVRSRIFALLPGQWQDDGDSEDAMAQVADGGPDPAARAMMDEAMRRLESALGGLPARQQQAFSMRCLEGLNVAETAAAMGCSEGSVKTHYFRALQTLRGQLGEVW
jgi:RNA polymerase sigma-70 factor (ECF subfamily)